MVSSIVRGVDFSADDSLKGETRLSGGIVRFDLDLSGGVDNIGGIARFGRGAADRMTHAGETLEPAQQVDRANRDERTVDR